MLHFAYGSNMSAALMRRRCPGARLEGRACLPGYRFVIMRSGYASVVPAPGSIVHGLLWRVTPRDVAALNIYENLAGGLYRAVTMAVVSHRRRRAALVYIGCDGVPGRPRPGYLDIVTQAARDAGFPPRYLGCLARWASVQNKTPSLPSPPHAGRVGRAPERSFMAIGPHEIKRLTIQGVVQKIGFRVWTERRALRLGLDGWVRNRLDGSVEVLVAGPPPAVAELIEQCRNGPPLARVDSLAIEEASELDLGHRRPGETFSLLPTA